MIGLGAKSPEIKVQRQPEVPGSLRLRALDWATVSAASNRCVPLYHLLVSGRRHFNDTEQATVGRKQFEVALAIVLFVDPAGFDAGTQHFQDLLCDRRNSRARRPALPDHRRLPAPQRYSGHRSVEAIERHSFGRLLD